MKTGISIYLSSKMEKNEEVIRKAHESGVTYGFTSLHIPEEEYSDYKEKVRYLLKLCVKAGIDLTMDVDSETPDRLGVKRMEDLLDFGVKSIRLDYGFSDLDVVNLSKSFHVVWNASTISPYDIKKWKRLGADTSGFTACHNFYPKPYTGLSLSLVKEINQKLKLAGYETESFVPGDLEFRGPLYEGLPTIEEHRHKKAELITNMLDLYNADTDIVLVGDVNISDNNWIRLKEISDGVISLRAELYDFAEKLSDSVHHDRPDFSEYIIRSQESRGLCKDLSIPPSNTIDCEVGSICISNDNYLRYKGEIEICKCKRPADSRINVIGKICDEDLKYLPYIQGGLGFKLIV